MQDEEFWPSEVISPNVALDTSDLEVKHDTKVAKINMCNSPSVVVLQHYSCWYKLRRAVAWILKFGHFLHSEKGEQNKVGTILMVSELKQAERGIIRFIQAEAFCAEISSLEMKGYVTKNSTIAKLNPLLVAGLLRIGGRMGLANLSDEEKHPLILPYRGHVVDLIIRNCHERMGHMGRS